MVRLPTERRPVHLRMQAGGSGLTAYGERSGGSGGSRMPPFAFGGERRVIYYHSMLCFLLLITYYLLLITSSWRKKIYLISLSLKVKQLSSKVLILVRFQKRGTIYLLLFIYFFFNLSFLFFLVTVYYFSDFLAWAVRII